MPNFSRLDQAFKNFENFLNRMAVGLNVFVVEAAKKLHGAIRPVKLIQIDIVRLQTFEALIDRFVDLGFALFRVLSIVAQPSERRSSSNLCGKYDLVTVSCGR